MKIKEIKKKLQKEVNPAWPWVLATAITIFAFFIYSYLVEPKWLPEPVNNFSKKIVDELILGERDSNKTENQEFKQEKSEESKQVSNIDTSNWQTYENKELGFSIKYPEDWTIDKINDVISINLNEDSQSGLWIYPSKDTSLLDPDSWWLQESKKYDAKFTKERELYISGRKASLYKEIGGLEEKHYIVFTSNAVLDILVIGLGEKEEVLIKSISII